MSEESTLQKFTIKSGTVVLFQGVALTICRDTPICVMDYPYTLEAIPSEFMRNFHPPGPPAPALGNAKDQVS